MVCSYISSHFSYQSSNIPFVGITQTLGSGITAQMSHPTVSKTYRLAYDATQR